MQTPTLSLATRSPDLEDLIEKTRGYIHAAKSPATLRAYRTDFEDFTRFCDGHNLPHLPATPTTVALYIADRAGSLRSATITRRLTSITKAHQAAGFEESPSSNHHFVVSETLKGIRRSIGTAQQGKAPLLTADIRRIVGCCPETLAGLRDQALILVGLCRRLPSLGARRNRLRPPLLHRGRPHHRSLPLEDRPGGGRSQGRYSLGEGGDNLPGPCAAPLVGGVWHQLRCRLSRGQPPWQALPPAASTRIASAGF
ncbi:MAG: site-specific integrase [Acidobacteriaceae bacterium]